MENLETKKDVAQSHFCRAEYNMQYFAKTQELPSRKEVIDALGMLDKWSESAMDIMSNLFDLYDQYGMFEKQLAIADEMEILEDRYSKASEVAMRYLESLAEAIMALYGYKINTRSKITAFQLCAIFEMQLFYS